MLQSQYEVGGSDGAAPLLAVKGLKKWIIGEYGIFNIYAKFIFTMLFEYHEGNAFDQAIHDAATLKNHHKMLAMGATFVMPGLLDLPSKLSDTSKLPDRSKMPLPPMQPITTCIAMVPLVDGCDTTTADVLRAVFKKVLGMV